MGSTPPHRQHFSVQPPPPLKMPNIKIYYFDFHFWRAEVSRMALYLGNVPFEDVRISKDQIPALKEAGKILYGNQVPTMEVDGKVVAQTGAIARYCGKQGGFYPRDDDLAAAKIDEIIDTATDITMAIGRTFGMADAEKMAARAVLGKETLAMYRLVGWISGGVLDGLPTNLVDSYPQIKANVEATKSNEKVKAYLAEKYPGK